MELSFLGIYIIEKDTNNDIIWSWIYPKLLSEERDILTQRCNFQFNENFEGQNFTFLKIKSNWFYVLIEENFINNSHIKKFAIILKSNEYNPNKFDNILEILNKKYVQSNDPIEIQKLYWSIYTGNITNSNENGSYQIQNFKEYNQTGNIKGLIRIFELETILIFNAILLKRRVLVYHDNLHDLLKYMKAISSLVHRRDPNFYLHPWVEDNSNDLLEFKSKNWYIVGTIQKSITTKTDLFDLIVNIPNAEIQIMPNAKESFTMTKIHKEIALSMVQLSQDTNVSDYNIKCTLSDKVDDIITQLKSLGTVDVSNEENEKFITLEHLRSKKFNANIETFLFNLALAENIIML